MPTKCNMDITFYPWDIQNCDVHIAHFGYLPTEVRLLPGRSDIMRRYFTENGRWLLENSSVSHGNLEVMSLVNLHFQLKRKSTFFIINVILPIVFMSVLNIMVFQLPTESGERISYCITVLLAIAVFLTLVGENLPNISRPMPIICYYLMSVLCLSVLTCFVVILNMKVYYKEGFEKVPSWLQSVYRFFHLRSACCKSRRKAGMSRSSHGKEHANSPVDKSQTLLECTSKQVQRETTNTSIGCISHETGSVKANRMPNENCVSQYILYQGKNSNKKTSGDSIQGKDKETVANPAREMRKTCTWRHISHFIDKLCFIFALFTLLLLTLMFIISMSLNINVLP